MESDTLMPSYVDHVSDEIVVQTQSDESAEQLEELGFRFIGRGKRRGAMYQRVIKKDEAHDHDKVAAALQKLVDLGLAFSSGKELCPIEVATHYREQGKLQGKLQNIYWTGPGKWHLREL
jgi:hypothetical protein